MIVSENHGDTLFIKQFQSYVLDKASDKLPAKYQNITATERSIESYLDVLGGERL